MLGIIGVLVDFFGLFFGIFLGAEENREKASPIFYCCIKQFILRLQTLGTSSFARPSALFFLCCFLSSFLSLWGRGRSTFRLLGRKVVVEDRREKRENRIVFLLFYSYFFYSFKYFSALLRNSIRKSANWIKKCLKITYKGKVFGEKWK